MGRVNVNTLAAKCGNVCFACLKYTLAEHFLWKLGASMSGKEDVLCWNGHRGTVYNQVQHFVLIRQESCLENSPNVRFGPKSKTLR
jgi:hypothetical protein